MFAYSAHDRKSPEFPELAGKRIVIIDDEAVISVDYWFQLLEIGARPQAVLPTNTGALSFLETYFSWCGNPRLPIAWWHERASHGVVTLSRDTLCNHLWLGTKVAQPDNRRCHFGEAGIICRSTAGSGFCIPQDEFEGRIWDASFRGLTASTVLRIRLAIRALAASAVDLTQVIEDAKRLADENAAPVDWSGRQIDGTRGSASAGCDPPSKSAPIGIGTLFDWWQECSWNVTSGLACRQNGSFV
jgi:hypothetical protein